jgi:hypothetical protein
MKKILMLLFAVSLVLGMTGVASALTLSSVEGAWTGAVGGSNVNYPTDVYVTYGNHSEDQVRWGVPASSAGQSGLGFTGIAPPSSTFGIGDAFEIGQLQHFNTPINGGTGVSAVDLTITLDFTNPAGLNDSFLFNFTVNETPNNTGTSPADDDFIFFPSSFPDQTFNIGGVEYTLELLGFGVSADSLVDQFQSPEGGTNSTLLWAKITTPPSVPEPGTMLLFGLGLLGLVGFRRKFKK